MLNARSFQQWMFELVRQILNNLRRPHSLYLDVTPGAGKSVLAAICSLLIPTYADALCWLVPRKSLCKQGMETFTNQDLAALFGYTATIRESVDLEDPTRGHEAFVATYQAVVSKKINPLIEEFQRQRYVLFLDEPHHIRDNFLEPDHETLKWKETIAPLVALAKLRVFASGTFDRGDGDPIAFIPYMRRGNKYVINFPDDYTTLHYSRQQAMDDGVITPLMFSLYDCAGQWIDKHGETITVESWDVTQKKDEPAMLDVALKTEWAESLMTQTVDHWRNERRRLPGAKLLVVAPEIKWAKKYVKFLREVHRLDALIATSDKDGGMTEDAQRAIRRFQGVDNPSCDVLVTVAMAYEGLDVKALTHICCLTRYRTQPWLEQCFARVSRLYDDKEYGYIFLPDDPAMRTVLDRMLADKDIVLQATWPQHRRDRKVPPPVEKADETVPLCSVLTGVRQMDASSGEMLTRDQTEFLQGIMRQVGVDIPAPKLEQLIRLSEMRFDLPPSANRTLPSMSPNDQEMQMRQAINDHASQVDRVHGWEPGTTNGFRKAKFRKPIRHMRLTDLNQAWLWQVNTYPLPDEFPNEDVS